MSAGAQLHYLAGAGTNVSINAPPKEFCKLQFGKDAEKSPVLRTL